MGQLKPNQILNKAYRQVAIETEDFNRFKEALHTLLSTISDGQREETQKEHLRNFLSDTFYKPYYMAPEEDIDLAVRLDKTSKSNIGLLIEVKSTTNKNEMISVGNLNRKALQELLLYYLRERISKKNSDIKYLIATNVYEYFIFETIFTFAFTDNEQYNVDRLNWSKKDVIAAYWDLSLSELLAGIYFENVVPPDVFGIDVIEGVSKLPLKRPK